MRGVASGPEKLQHREEAASKSFSRSETASPTTVAAAVGLSKPIKANIEFASAIDGPTGDEPPENHFGITRTFWGSASSLVEKPSAFEVMGFVNNRIEWQVVGPGGLEGKHTDIESENDSDITALNYEEVVKDLTPDLSDQGGRPLRDVFWARDLVITHEQFHANDRRDFGKQHVEEETKWLNAQTAKTKDEARELMHQIVPRARNASKATMAKVGEPRAYGAGVPEYLSRTSAIAEKGRSGGYK